MSHQKISLDLDGYIFDTQVRVWFKTGSPPISYTDGSEVEQKLNSIFDQVSDLSTDSIELHKFISDWPTRYYFSSYRANLLRPLKSSISGNVLEIGAGCGALTRYLGETAKSVVAVEGGFERAKICARRCTGLDNVQVVCEQFENFSTVEKFDAVTLIGVLEYARIYGGGELGPLNLLKKARQMLAPDGVLILAIENQLGAKYFAGANEDHVNQPWFGIADSYKSNGAVTFGKVQLVELLQEAGFNESDFYIPLPDYKLPVSVINSNAIKKAKNLGLDSSLFSAMSVAADPHNAESPTFPLETTLRAIGRNDLTLDLANSFLIVSKAERIQDSSNKLNIPVIFHYGSTRKKEYSKETILHINNDKIEVKRNPLYPNQVKNESSTYSINWDDESYVIGELYIEKLFRIVNSEEWHIDQIINWAKPWVELLQNNIISPDRKNPQLSKLPNNFLDATPFNLVRTRDDIEQFKFIDLEWCDDNGPEFLHVVVRGLIGSFDKISSVARPHDTIPLPLSQFNLLEATLLGIVPKYSVTEVCRVLMLENQFREHVTGLNSSMSIRSLRQKVIHIRDSDILSNKLSHSKTSLEETNGLSLRHQEIYRLFTHYKSLDEGERFLRDKSRIERVLSQVRIGQNDNQISDLAGKINKYPRVSIFGFLKDSARLLKSLGLLRPVLKEQGMLGAVIALITWVLLRISGVFDYKFYLEKNHALEGTKYDLLFHYVTLGYRNNLQPNALFDARWYSKHYQINSSFEINPLLHYVIRSPKQGQSPHPLFDARYYRTRTTIEYSFLQTDLYHYLTNSGIKGYSPHPLFTSIYYYQQIHKENFIRYDLLTDYLTNPSNANLNPNIFFDSQFYLKSNPDVFKTNVPPFLHFGIHGSKERRDPSEEFSIAGYYKLNPDVEKSSHGALSHYLEFGIYEGRKSITRISYQKWTERDRPKDTKVKHQKLVAKKIEISDLLALPSRSETIEGIQGIDIIVPVYKGKNETLSCIASVLRSTSSLPIRLIVVNDKSPDEDLSVALETLSKNGKFILINNQTNLGFVQSVNIGMEYSRINDVILLNSDTEVYNNWLDRLNIAAYSSSDIGTVTPYSNSATICSYPEFCNDHPVALEICPEEIDRLTAEVNNQQYIDIPTAVGFCMYIKRVCLNQVGLFDAKKFGLGYGEENDFCIRASRLNWRHILATDTYVLHYGSTSFADEKSERIAEATQIINRDYPRYDEYIQEFIEKDPAQLSRLKLDLARVEKFLSPQRFLFVSHLRGGGTKRHIDQLVESLKQKGISTIYLESATNGSGGFYLRVGGLSVSDIPTLSGIEFGSRLQLLEVILSSLQISHAHIHSMIDFKLSTVGHVLKILQNLDIAFDVTVHDYAWFCPRIHMVDNTEFYCGGSARDKCQACVTKNGSSWGYIDIDPFRQENELFLNAARRVFCPSYDVLTRMRNNYPNSKLVLMPHSTPKSSSLVALPATDNTNKTRKICLLGAIGKHKGSEILLRCVEDAHNRKLPLEFKIVGYTDNQSELLKYANVTCTGAYDEGEIHNLILQQDCGICLFPSVCPETFSYTLNAALQAGLYPISFDFGAIADRINSIQWGTTLDSTLRDNPSAINDILMNIEVTGSIDPTKLQQQFITYPDILADYYEL